MAHKGQASTPGFDSEAYLASLWKEIIGVEQARPADKFLDLGGNSLTLNIMLKRIEKETSAAMPARLFFDPETSTLANLASVLDGLRTRTPDLSVVTA